MKRRIITPAQRRLEDRLIQEWLAANKPTRCVFGAATGQTWEESLDVRDRIRRARLRKINVSRRAKKSDS